MDPETVSDPRPNREAVIRRELEWHEHSAAQRYSLDEFLYAPPAFDEVIDPGLRFLCPQSGDSVLDLGCGEGKETRHLMQLGLSVVSLDLSHAQLARARQRVSSGPAGRSLRFVQANAEELPFLAGQFDLVYGKAILHHLDVGLAAAEIFRLLKPGGRAVFAEPLAYHPLIWGGRHLTPHFRTRDEHPVTLSELRRFGREFSSWKTEVFYMLAPGAYIFRLVPGGNRWFQRAHVWLHRLDQQLWQGLSWLKRFAWYGLVAVCKDDGTSVLRAVDRVSHSQ